MEYIDDKYVEYSGTLTYEQRDNIAGRTLKPFTKIGEPEPAKRTGGGGGSGGILVTPDTQFKPSKPEDTVTPTDPVKPADLTDSAKPADPADSVTPTDSAIAETSFTGIPDGAYYFDAVNWAVEKGITKGAAETTFDPDGTVNRGQTVTFIYRAAGGEPVDSEINFKDLDPGQYYMDAVKWAVANGITKGTGEDTFIPNEDCTRGQIVTLLYRYYAA